MNLRGKRRQHRLGREEVAAAGSVELDDAAEADGLGGHVDADGEGLGGEEQLDESRGEEDLHDLLEQREHAGVVHADAALQQRQHGEDLRQLLVLAAQIGDAFPEIGGDGGGLVAGEEFVGDACGAGVAEGAAEREDDALDERGRERGRGDRRAA